MHVYVRCAHVILKIGMRYANESGKREDTDFQVSKTENVDGLIGLCCVVKFIIRINNSTVDYFKSVINPKTSM